jgi:hypothetical protein
LRGSGGSHLVWATQRTIARVHHDNYGVYGARKVWLALNRQGIPVAWDRAPFTRDSTQHVSVWGKDA